MIDRDEMTKLIRELLGRAFEDVKGPAERVSLVEHLQLAHDLAPRPWVGVTTVANLTADALADAAQHTERGSRLEVIRDHLYATITHGDIDEG